LRIVRFVFNVFIRSGISLSKFGAGQGAWAVITGCTDGIGREFALQLAQKRFNVVLLSRTLSKLEDLSKEIENQFGVQTKVYPIDFSKADASDYHDVQGVLDSLDVTVLVNNVGFSYDYPMSFADLPEDRMTDMIEINNVSHLRMTKMALPQMVTRKNGLIINLSSFSGRVPAPLLSVYSATKAFTSFFSNALGYELRDQGIVVQTVEPYYVVSAMSKIRKPTWIIPTAKKYVKAVLSRIGVNSDSSMPYSTAAYPGHALAFFPLLEFVPVSQLIRFAYKASANVVLRKQKKDHAKSI